MGPRNRIPATRASRGAPRGDDSMIDRIAYDHRTAPPHAVVGIFIVKNSRQTMVARFCNRRSASRCCWHARPRLACNKKPGAASRPGGWRSFGEYAFLEDSRYTSQEESG